MKKTKQDEDNTRGRLNKRISRQGEDRGRQDQRKTKHEENQA